MASALATLMLASGVGSYEYVRNAQSGSAARTTISTTSTASSADKVAAKVDAALVDVTSTLAGGSVAKGTGMVIGSDGIVLTNNHVVDGATKISVRLVTSGRTYAATLVGYSATSDVAVLRLSNASGLATITAADATSANAGESVVVIGNAGGVDGTPAAVDAVVTATGQTITASEDSGSGAETLHGLVQVSGDIREGDSGGAVANASGQVVAMTTAASTESFSATTTGYAIPIQTALTVANQIISGVDNGTVHQGEHGVLGVEVEDASNGAGVAAVEASSAAARAGLAANDVITAINGNAIAGGNDLETVLRTTHVGDRIDITWIDSNGATHTASTTLSAGAA
jgi:S1-C subfamily serine protease